jgi:predicted ATPase
MLRSVRLRNFRSLRDTGEVQLRPIVLLVGANSSGKSSFLRFFPLLKQTAWANSNSPLLWYRDNGDVDFGSFTNTLFRGAKEPWIEVSASCELDERKPPAARGSFRFTSRIASGADGRSFVERFSVSALGDTFELEAAADATLGALRLNGRELPQVEGRTSQRLTGPIARLESPAFRALADRLLTEKIQERAHENASPGTLAMIAGLIDDGSAEDILRDMKLVHGGVKGWHENIASLSEDSSYVREIKELVFVRELDLSYLSKLEAATARFARGVRYLGPFRRPPQRFYRKAELAVDEIDRDGSNLAMFLDSLSSEDGAAFSAWVREHFGFGVHTERRDAHVALMIDTDAASEFNLMDMGFGMSQLLPVIAQCWLSSGQLRSGQIPLFRDPARSILPGTAPMLIAVEQPELHLHPLHQAQLADMFCNTANATNALGQPLSLCVETHSEAMIYRFGELVESGKLPRESITILFFERQAGRDESIVRPIEFDENGVLQDWPIGFFRG